jgi:hypothetical protein
MRVNGKWMLSDDGVIRPVVPGFVRAAGGHLVEVSFLLDAGADRTVFSARFLSRLQPLAAPSFEQTLLSGIGGSVGSIAVETVIGFRMDNQRIVTVRGTFGVFTEGESADLSVLGRDVTNNFSVIYDYPNQIIALLAPSHSYEIRPSL